MINSQTNEDRFVTIYISILLLTFSALLIANEQSIMISKQKIFVEEYFGNDGHV